MRPGQKYRDRVIARTVARIPVDQRRLHARSQRADHVRTWLIADMQRPGRFDAESFEGRPERAHIRFLVPDQGRGHDQIHFVRELQPGAKLSHISVGVRNDRGQHARRPETLHGLIDIAKGPVAIDQARNRGLRGLLIFGPIRVPDRGRVGGGHLDPGHRQPAADEFIAYLAAFFVRSVAHWMERVHLRPVVLGRQVSLFERSQVDLTTAPPQYIAEAFPTGGRQFNQRVVEVEGDELNGYIVGCHARILPGDQNHAGAALIRLSNRPTSTFPPDSVTPTRAPRRSSFPARTAANAQAPLGSSTILRRSKANRMAATMSASLTVITSCTYF